MNQVTVIEELLKKYPGKRVIKNDTENPTEILCEVKPTSDHPSFSLAIAVIDKSIPHVHRKSTEEYTILRGQLTLHVDEKTFTLKTGQTFYVRPHQIHWAEGNETWVSCFSQPGWTREDHFESDGKTEQE
jgi:mannose-6-phosphate isomerase-like protein (cupin superfamily)